MSTAPDLVTLGPAPADARRTVIAVHGRGHSAEWMRALADRVADPELCWLIPNAPGGSWYPERFMEPVERNQPNLDDALSTVTGLLDHATSLGADPQRTALLGFSQGACLVAHAVLTQQITHGPVALLTGGYIGPEGTALPTPRDLTGVPVFLETAEDDPWVPLPRVTQTVDALHAAGASVRLDVRPGDAHEIPDTAIPAIRSLFAG